MIKTRLTILEEMYNEAHGQCIAEEFLIEGLQSKQITLIKPDEQEMAKKVELTLVKVKNDHERTLASMKRIMGKIKEEEKHESTLHSDSKQPGVQPQ